MNSWHGYPSIFALGHRAIADLLTGPVLVEEKIDGSQFSFGVFAEYDISGQPTSGRVLRARSKGAVLMLDAPEKMFSRAIETVRALEPRLTLDWTYRGEYLRVPKHNALAYDRIPAQHVIIFDINSGHETYLRPDEKAAEAARLGLETVPLLYEGMISDAASVRAFLARESVLGGQTIEGVVIKPALYDRFGPDKKCLMGKFVSEAFKEVASEAWKESNPGPQDVLSRLGATYGTPARWQKAVQHLRERGDIEGSPRDIERLMREIPDDIAKECEADIRDALWAYAWPHLRRIVSRGVPEWYKDQLLKAQFNAEDA